MTTRQSRPAVLDQIGNTPLVQVTRLDTGPCTLFLKLENQNPGGSIKDRIGLAMVDTAERDGRLKPGGTVVEATAGNTGLGLALVARDIPGAFFADQFNNPANALAHETSTGPEIWQQSGHDLDAIVCGVGSGGTLAGLTAYFKKVQPALGFVLADPKGSIVAEYTRSGKVGQAGSWAVEGIGEDFIPTIADLSGVCAAYEIPDEESFGTARELLRAEGILGGCSRASATATCATWSRAATKRAASSASAPTIRCSPPSRACAPPTCRSCRCSTASSWSA